VGAVVFVYAASLTIPNLIVAWTSGLFAMAPWKGISEFSPQIAWKTLRAGLWYYLTTVSLICKTHALTFLVSAMAGPAEAGLFYLLLRLSEIVGNVGATASETSLAALASASDVQERRENFRQSWLHVSLFCTQGSLVFVFLIQQFLSLWLDSEETIPHVIGFTLAAFGLAGAFSRVVVNASMGLGLTKGAAIAGLWEACGSICGAALGFHLQGLTGLFLGGSVGILALLPAAVRVSEQCGWRSPASWFLLLHPLLPGFLISGVLLYAASLSHVSWIWFGALIPCASIALLQLKRLHSLQPLNPYTNHP
jgi:O-antigen/teichoic acid export membrane protein